MQASCIVGPIVATLWSSSALAQRFPVPWREPSVQRHEEVRGPQAPALGNADAPVTIVSFSDYRCPYCRELSGNLIRLLEEYPDKVRIVYRHFAMTPESRAMAEAALCASEQGRFADYHQLVFSTPGASADSLTGLAEQLGLNVESFRKCTSTNRYSARVEGDIREGERLAIQVTPTFFINGVRIVGSASAEKLRGKLAELLPASAGGDAR